MAAQTNIAGPLAGIRILDLSTVLMGPLATRILADYGADVVKVEPPDGDLMRKAGPMRSDGMGPLFLNGNRNKRSIVIDIRKPAGRDVLLRLAANAHAFVHNIRPVTMERLGLGHRDVAAVNASIVYASLVGFGQSGPYAGKPAYDDLIQGASGFASLFARADGGAPRYAPALVADRMVGLGAAHAILAALFHRERTGEGQAIEVPMFESMAEHVLGDHLGGLAFDPPIGPTGYPRLLSANRRPYRTQDGYIAVLVYTDRQWESFFSAIGREDEYRREPKLNDFGVRASHYDEVYGLVGEILTTRTSAEWLSLLAKADIPSMPLHDIESLVDDPHIVATGFVRTAEHPSEGEVKVVGPAARFAGMPFTLRHHAPRLGADGSTILQEAGFDRDEIEELIAAGVTARSA